MPTPPVFWQGFLAPILLVMLSGCSSTVIRDQVVAYTPAENFPDRYVEIIHYSPAFIQARVSYEYAATLYDYDTGFDVITLPLANRDIVAGAALFCRTRGLALSSPIDFSHAKVGVISHRAYFNCFARR